jgi:hypothetical protein
MSSPADLARVMLGLARDDEFAARSLLAVDGVADAIVGLHAQQAVEKSLKPVLASRAIDFPYTPDLDGLLELFQTNGLGVPSEPDGVDRLAPYGVHMSYGTSHTAGLERDQALLLGGLRS